MKKYILYAHGGSKNHGCEALVRTTSKLLKDGKHEIYLSSFRPEEDRLYHIDDLCTVTSINDTAEPNQKSLAFYLAYLQMMIFHDYSIMDDLAKAEAVKARRKDIALSIGGDSYCYNQTDELIYFHNIWKSVGMKTVFWGCSLEPKLLDDPKIAKDIKNFDLITARETISYNALKKVNKNTVLMADPAFLLDIKEEPLPEILKNSEFVGINVSPLVTSCEEVSGITMKNYCNLIEKILNETKYKIMLIPHVVWSYNDDRTVLNELYEKYKHTNRVALIEDCSCEVLKGYISKCRFFVGARTHATIAAYSTCVPTLVVGYSVKARGIAKDIFGSYEDYVLPVQNLKNEDDLSKAFDFILKNEKQIKDRLLHFMPEYKNRVYDGVNAVKAL